MGSSLIDSGHQETHTEWSLRRVTGFDLRFSSKLVYHPLYWVLAIVSVPIIQALAPHVLADESGIGSQTRENHSHMVIYIINLLLMARQLIGAHLERNKDLKLFG